MHKIVDVIAPRGLVDMLYKAGILVFVYAVADLGITTVSERLTGGSYLLQFVMSFAIGAPFGLFVMEVMRRQYSLQDRLAVLAATDVLTGLPNRRAFLARAAACADENCEGVVLIVDADHFKSVNDTYGHDVGDRCLQAISDHLRRNLRKEDLVGRLGGEEFAIFLRQLDTDIAKDVAARICSPIRVDCDRAANNELSITLSVGAVRLCVGGEIMAALKLADEALYAAKSNGRARVEWSEVASAA